ncbi:MAG: hypothetical protein EBS95_09125 [Chitinophagia bacterium]|jgi:hypothetical protein|nr:hypothetical protein [Chitinophagia bacterium]
MKIFYCFLLGLLFSTTGFAQEKNNEQQPKMKLSFEGMIGASFGKNFYTINLGGPTLMLGVSKDMKIGIGAVPSLYAEGGKLGTRLGYTPRVDYKNIVFMTPFFPVQPFGKWVGSVGIGYKFQKAKK